MAVTPSRPAPAAGLIDTVRGARGCGTAMLLRSLQESTNSVPTHRWLAVCCAHMGRLEEAQEMINRLRAITLDAAPGASSYRNPEHCEPVQDRLRAVLRNGATPWPPQTVG